MTPEITAPFTLRSTFRFRTLSKQAENGVVIIGRGDRFLELPAMGLDFMAWLDEEGMNLADARARFEALYNPFPDNEVADLMNTFLQYDFIALIDGQAVDPKYTESKVNMDWFPQKVADFLYSTPVLITWIVFVVPAIALWFWMPELWPKRLDYFWHEYNFVVILIGLLIWIIDMSLHELAHFIACRAKGITASITWTQRLGFFPMSQTIMHDIWSVPRSERLLPIAAGMVSDVARLSFVIYLLFFHVSNLLPLSELVAGLLKYYVLTSSLALIAQFWFFSKMDGYFLFSTLLGQRNLQDDTYSWLKSKTNPRHRFDRPNVGNMRMIFIYTIITVIGGGLFVGQFLLINLPIKLQLLWESIFKIIGYFSNPVITREFADGVAVLVSQLVYWGLLIYAHWREGSLTKGLSKFSNRQTLMEI